MRSGEDRPASQTLGSSTKHSRVRSDDTSGQQGPVILEAEPVIDTLARSVNICTQTREGLAVLMGLRHPVLDITTLMSTTYFHSFSSSSPHKFAFFKLVITCSSFLSLSLFFPK